MFARWLLAAAAALPLVLHAAPAGALDTSILSTLNYDSMQWHEDKVNPGSWYSVLSGDLSGPGRFVVLNKVLKGNFNRPHAHHHAREIYVVQGTWWVGTGRVLNPDASVAKAPGSFVVQSANQVHWDGAKGEDVLLLIEGEGPATAHFVN